MRNDIKDSTVLLAKRQIHRIEPVPGARVVCLSGALWLTLDGDSRDLIVEAGEDFTLEGPEPALISALEDSHFMTLWPQPAA